MSLQRACFKISRHKRKVADSEVEVDNFVRHFLRENVISKKIAGFAGVNSRSSLIMGHSYSFKPKFSLIKVMLLVETF